MGGGAFFVREIACREIVARKIAYKEIVAKRNRPWKRNEKSKSRHELRIWKKSRPAAPQREKSPSPDAALPKKIAPTEAGAGRR